MIKYSNISHDGKLVPSVEEYLWKQLAYMLEEVRVYNFPESCLFPCVGRIPQGEILRAKYVIAAVF